MSYPYSVAGYLRSSYLGRPSKDSKSDESSDRPRVDVGKLRSRDSPGERQVPCLCLAEMLQLAGLGTARYLTDV